MAILAQIRKRPIYLIMIIGMALFAFVIGGVLKGNNGSKAINIGSINGEEISSQTFSKKLELQKNSRASSIQKVKNVWDNIVKDKVYQEQLKKAGIVIGEKDIWDSLINNTGIQNDERFKDESGLFDGEKLKEYIATLKDSKDTPEGRAAWQNWVNYESNIKSNLEQSTYDNMVKAGLTASLKEGERTYISENTNVDIQFVYEPYATVKDENITISDTEINSYIQNHANEYKAEPSTEIEFVKFAINPSQDDTNKIKTKISTLINNHEEWNNAAKSKEDVVGFYETKDIKGFVNEYSDLPYVDKVYMKKDLPANVYDSIVNKSLGTVYGPYKDGEYFKIAKLINKNGLKSAKSSHILIAYTGSERAKPTVTRTREEAQKLAKTVFAKVNANNFADLAKEYSDGGSAPKGGDIGWFDEKSALAQEYKKFIFDNKKGKIAIVETSFGFHIIKIDDTKVEDGLNLAVVALKIEPSEETESKIFQNAESFASDLTNGKDIIALAKEKSYKIESASNLNLLSDNIPVIGRQREIVKWTFDKESKKGTVKRFDLENGDYAVVKLKDIHNSGYMPLKDAKAKITPILTKQKKAKIIKAKFTENSSLDDIAKALNKTINSSTNFSISNALLKVGGRDNNIAGAVLYMKEGDVKAIEGNNGVYIIKIIKKNKPYELKKFDTYSNNITTKLKSRSAKIYDALKSASKIEDNRAVFY